ncbi:MAG: DNA/RNA non-specific endonuclease [Pseudomonadales bacterium]|nr:DNA/RNA non-specific endonuclease [Pseudomonadales bacterium]NRA14115.1 DNA/RNA non-specific endonuclease [Oceanospirillaceae bacterium]
MKLMTVLSLLCSLHFSTANADVLSVHCPTGCPSNPADNDLVFGHLYALSNNPQTKFADWVAYEVSPINFGTSPGRVWLSDPLLNSARTLEKADYKGANSSALKADRGHQAPLAAFAGSRYWSELNRLSNITPQHKDLNQGPWKHLEEAVRRAATYDKSLFVITGPLFHQQMPLLPDADESHVVPAGYFKVIYDLAGNSANFIMQQHAKRQDDYCGKRSSVQEMHMLIKFQLPKFKSNDSLYRRLGCVY